MWYFKHTGATAKPNMQLLTKRNASNVLNSAAWAELKKKLSVVELITQAGLCSHRGYDLCGSMVTYHSRAKKRADEEAGCRKSKLAELAQTLHFYCTFFTFFFPPVVAEIICCGRTNFSFSAAGTNRKKKEPKQVNTFLSGDSLRSGWNYCLLTYFQISEYWLYSARSLPNPGTKCESGLSLALLR